MFVKVTIFVIIAALACITPSQGRPKIYCPDGECTDVCPMDDPDCDVLPVIGDSESILKVQRNMEETTEPTSVQYQTVPFSLERSAAAAAAASRADSTDDPPPKYCPQCFYPGPYYREGEDAEEVTTKRPGPSEYLGKVQRNMEETTEPTSVQYQTVPFSLDRSARAAASAASAASNSAAAAAASRSADPAGDVEATTRGKVLCGRLLC